MRQRSSYFKVLSSITLAAMISLWTSLAVKEINNRAYGAILHDVKDLEPNFYNIPLPNCKTVDAIRYKRHIQDLYLFYLEGVTNIYSVSTFFGSREIVHDMSLIDQVNLVLLDKRSSLLLDKERHLVRPELSQSVVKLACTALI